MTLISPVLPLTQMSLFSGAWDRLNRADASDEAKPLALKIFGSANRQFEVNGENDAWMLKGCK